MIPEMQSALLMVLSNATIHLWQSTLFLIAAAGLVGLLRGYSARVRYWIWLVASVKFFVPFAAIAKLGSLLSPRSAPPPVDSRVYFMFQTIGIGMKTDVLPAPLHGSGQILVIGHRAIALLVPACGALWAVGALIVTWMFCRRWLQASRVLRAASPLTSGREIRILRALQQEQRIRRPIELRLTNTAVEPSVFGILRPALLWPAGISSRLDDAHVETVLTHELAHIMRRDNLFSALHALVQAIFWFHPLVWWLGSRLIEERERACDEAVLAAGRTAEVYAEGLLRTCRFCVDSAFACAAGVTGGELRSRVRDIMSQKAVRRLNAGTKWLLATAGVATVTVPLCFGLAHPTHTFTPLPLAPLMQTAQSSPPAAPPLSEKSDRDAAQAANVPVKVPEFAVASIKPDKSGTMMVRIMFQPDGFSATNASLKQLLLLTWGVNDDRLSGAPAWIDHANYDIEAKVDGADVPAMKSLTMDQRREMVRKLLEDRFALKFHEETRDLPVYSLVVARSGLKMHEAKPGDTYANGIKTPDGKGGAGMMTFNGKQLTGQGVPVSNLIQFLARQTGHTVIDKTDLTGKYDFTLDLPARQGPMAMAGPHDGEATPGDSASEDPGPSIFTLVQDQLGLKLESTKAPVSIIVIDHIEQPSEN